MAERYISINNVVGSGTNGKVMLSDLDLSQDDMARFANLLTSYIKSGDFAADLTSPDWFSSGPSNYNIIPYFDSFENYIDKQILGPVSPNVDSIVVSGTNFRAYNGYVSAKVECKDDGATKFLHADTNTSDPWITVGTEAIGENFYRFSGYFWFTGPNNGVKLEVINTTTQDNDFAGSIEILNTDTDNGTNKWTRFVSDKFHLNLEDLITFKLTVNLIDDEPTVFYMDALQLEVVVGDAEIKSFIQSGVVITDGSNIRVNSITANAIKANTITTSKLSSKVGEELNISGNTTIVAERVVNNLLPWTTDEFTRGYFEQGTINTSGSSESSIFYIRTESTGIPVEANKDYVVSLSSSLINNYSKIFFYTSAGVFINSVTLSLNNIFVNSGSNASYARITLAKDNLTEFDPDQIVNYYGKLESANSYLSGSQYRFDGNAATFTNAGLLIRKQTGPSTFENLLYFDPNTSSLKIKGELVAASGTFSGNITSGATITGADIKGGTITAGNLTENAADVVKMSSEGLWAGGATFSSGKFKVNTLGTLTAENANISGTITAGSGSKIGGWNIGASTIYNGTMKFDSSNNRIYLNDNAYFDSYSAGGYGNFVGNLGASGYMRADSFITTSGNVTLDIDGNYISSKSYLAGPTDEPLFLNNKPILTTGSTASQGIKGPIKVWLNEDGNTLYIRTD